LLLAPLCRGDDLRLLAFALLALAVQWVQMAVTVNAGASVHHIILLWPLPMIAIGVSFAAASRRLGKAGLPALAVLLAAALAAGGLQLNEYYRMAWRDGGSANWSDAIFRLSDYLKDRQAERVFSADWGITDSLRLLNRGQLRLDFIYDAIPRDTSPPDLPRIRAAVSRPGAVFLAHAPQAEVFPGSSEKLVEAARQAGYRKELLANIPDSFGRPVFEAYRFVAAPAPAAAARRGASTP
jgi:hypothetical protein